VKIIVTGSESFVGKVLVPMLQKQGHDVVGIDPVAPSFPGGVKADIRDAGLADHFPEGADAVIHLAAISREPDCAAKPVLAYDINVTGTSNVIEAARKKNIRQVILASSEWVYGEVANDGVQDEKTVIDPAKVQNEYAASKLVSEMALNVAVRRGLPAGTVLRFGIIYGPRMANWSAAEALLNNVRTKDEVIVGSLATSRRFIHVNDICGGIIAAIGRAGFEIFNLAGPEMVTLRQVIELSKAATGKSPKVGEKDAKAASIRNPVSNLAYAKFNWRPAISMQQGIAEIAAYFDKEEKKA
jgi:UDP-glucose 4-epimerase